MTQIAYLALPTSNDAASSLNSDIALAGWPSVVVLYIQPQPVDLGDLLTDPRVERRLAAVVAADVAAGRLQVVLEGSRRAEIGIHALTAHRGQMPPRVRALLDFLASHFRTHGPRRLPPSGG